MLGWIGRVYGEAAWRRRLWYANRCDARRRLRCPVISIGALTVGGSGKTPLTALVARTLLAMGERPAVLSRGHGRTEAVAGAVVVRDSQRLVGNLPTAGDEPWMLAQTLRDVVVVVAEDRYLAGRLAETSLGATVHLLDDGFQHLSLERGTDLLLVSPSDLEDPRVLPVGRLRERSATARFADALVVVGSPDAKRLEMATRLGLSRSFSAERILGPPTIRDGVLEPVQLLAGTSVLAVAGIALPGRFFDDLRSTGLKVNQALVFRDHHPFSSRDGARIEEAARTVGAAAIVTTEKDFARLRPLLPLALPVATVALSLEVEPADAFRTFIAERLALERSSAA